MPRKIKLITAVLLLSLGLSLSLGCQSTHSGYPVDDHKSADYLDIPNAKEDVYYDEFANDSASEEAIDDWRPGADPITGQEITDGKKIIYSYNLYMETTNADNVLEDSRKLIKKYDAYLVNSEISTRNGRDNRKLRDFHFVWKVKAEQASDFVEDLKELATVTNLSVSRDDLSREYYDTAARIENKKLEEKRLQELLKQAESVEDIMQIEARLSDLRAEIDGLSGQNLKIDRDVAESTVTVFISEFYQTGSSTYQEELSFSERVRDYFIISWNTLREGGEAILYFCIVFGPWLILIALIVVLIMLLVRKVKRKKRPARKAKRKKSALNQALPPQFPGTEVDGSVESWQQPLGSPGEVKPADDDAPKIES
ncbi:MAG: DUF4349 domain-containing protein [Eubacteriales bacterium]|nr:DUF4349 domain-containing protein [Eubacteriales bacterium]